jgi:hypothetical protein
LLLYMITQFTKRHKLRIIQAVLNRWLDNSCYVPNKFFNCTFSVELRLLLCGGLIHPTRSNNNSLDQHMI